MLRKRPPPMIGKLSQLLVSGGGRAVEAIGSPKMMMMMQSSPPPTRGGAAGFKSYDLGGRVGLKIVVALDKSTSSGSTDDDDDEKQREINVILPKKHAVCCTSKLNQQRSGPIPVKKNPIGFQREEENSTRDQNIISTNNHINILEEEEEYTYVTCHVPNKTFTKVYYDAGYNNNAGVLTTPQFVSPILIEPQEPLFPTSNFLSSCHLCGKKLHGKDIYMYRGEKGFCSTECRSSQIMMDERKERCGSEASRKKSMELSTSLTNDQIFSTRILAI